jgi:hypothetical protein
VDNDNAERQVLEIVLVLETFVNGDQNITFALSLGDKFGVRERTPFGFRDSHNFMIDESLP